MTDALANPLLACSTQLRCDRCGLTLKASEQHCPDCKRSREELTRRAKRGRETAPAHPPPPPKRKCDDDALRAPGQGKQGRGRDATKGPVTAGAAPGAPRGDAPESAEGTPRAEPEAPAAEGSEASTAEDTASNPVPESSDAGSESAASASLVFKGRGGALVRCAAQRLAGDAPELDIDAYVDPSSNKTFRRMCWAVLVSRSQRSLVDAWVELRDQIKCEARGFAYIAADTKKGHTVLLFKGGSGTDMAVRAGPSWQAYNLSSKDPLPFAKALLRCVQVIFSIDVESREQRLGEDRKRLRPFSRTQRVTALEAIQPYM